MTAVEHAACISDGALPERLPQSTALPCLSAAVILCTQVQQGSSIVTATRCMVMCMCVCSQAKLGGLEVVIDVGEFDEQWQRVAGQQFSMQNTLFVPHDFAVSESYYIFFYSDTTF